MFDKNILLCEWGRDGVMFADVKVGRSISIKTFERLEMPANARADELATIVRGLVEQRGWKGRGTVVLHAASRAEHHIIDSPPGSSAETTVLVERQLNDLSSQPLERFLHRQLRLRATKVDSLPRVNTLAVLIPVDEVDLVCGAVSDAGLTLLGLATLPLALLAAAAGVSGSGTEALIHLDRGVGTVAFVAAGVLAAQMQIQYGSGDGGGEIDAGTLAARVEQSLSGYRDRNPDAAITKVHLTGWDATSEVFEILTSDGHAVEPVATPRMSVSTVPEPVEGMDGFLYAHALLLWCAARPLPVNLVPRGVLRPARLRRLAATAVAVAATYGIVLATTGSMLGEQRRGVEAALATAQAAKDALSFDLDLETAEAEGQRRLDLVGRLSRTVPDVGSFLSALSLAAGDDTVLVGLAIVRDGDRHRVEISGRTFGKDAAAAQVEFERFVTAVRARTARELTVGEVKLDREGEHGQTMDAVGLRFELRVQLREKA